MSRLTATTPLAQAAGYAGGVLTLVAVSFLVDEPWRDTPHVVRALLVLLLAAGFVAFGALVRDPADADAGRRRLSGLFWFVATGAVAGAVGLALHSTGGAGFVVPGLAALVVAAVLYLIQPRAFQVVALVLSAAGLAAAVVRANDGHWPTYAICVGLVGVAAFVIGVAAVVRPAVAFATTGLFLVLAATGPLQFTDRWAHWSLWIALLAVAVAAAAWRLGAPLDLFAWFGAIPLLSRVIDEYGRDGTKVPLAMLALGLLLLVGALRWMPSRDEAEY
jgi:hypothetical protein